MFDHVIYGLSIAWIQILGSLIRIAYQITGDIYILGVTLINLDLIRVE